MKLVPAPCVWRDDQLVLDELPLAELAAHAEGRPLWLIGRDALERAWTKAPTALVPVGAFGSLELLSGAVAAGHWASATGCHDLRAAAAAGFAPERTLLTGDVLDDGALKEALLAGVAVAAPTADSAAGEPRALARLADSATRLERMAALLERPLPVVPADAPAPLRPSRLDGSGVLLVGVLAADERQLALDARLESRWFDGIAEVFSLAGGEPRPGRVAGLSAAPDLLGPGAAASLTARLHGTAQRGDWVVLPTRRALLGAAPDPTHGEPERLLVSGVHARPLTPAPLPVEGLDAG